MGYEIESSAYISFRWVSGQQNPLDVAVHSLHTANLLDDHADLIEGGSAQVVASALADALGASDESPYVTVGDRLVAIYVSAKRSGIGRGQGFEDPRRERRNRRSGVLRRRRRPVAVASS